MRVFRPIRTRDETIDRNLDAIAANFADLNGTPSAQQVNGHPCSTPITNFTVDTESVVVFRGSAASTGTLPGALSLGNGVSREVAIINDSAVALTVAVGQGDSLSGSSAVASTVKAIFRSDGASKWFRVV